MRCPIGEDEGKPNLDWQPSWSAIAYTLELVGNVVVSAVHGRSQRMHCDLPPELFRPHLRITFQIAEI